MLNKYYVFHGHFSPEREIMHASMLNDLERGEKVEVTYCAGSNGCPANPFGSISLCKNCISQNERALKIIGQKSKNKSIKPRKIKFFEIKADLSDVDDIKNITYKGSDTGYAILSTYIGLTRNFVPDLSNHITRKILVNLLNNFRSVYDFVTDDLLNCEGECHLHIFNGRLSNTRAVLRAGRQANRKVIAHERVGKGDMTTIFTNTLPHDIKSNQERINNLYIRYRSSADSIAEEFYTQKLKGCNVNDKVYVNNQKSNLLPAGWVDSIKNIVIFSSSEDEFKAIGKEWEGGVFEDQITGIRRICEIVDSDAMVYLRVHPNVQGASKDYKNEILSIKHERLSVIPPESKVSSYALLDKADIVIVFGSSIGAEASYWGKPVILLSNCFYAGLGGCYNPKDVDELRTMLNQPKLDAIKSEMPKKMAIYWMKGGVPLPYFEGNKEIGHKLAGRTIHQSLIEKLVYILFKGVQKILTRLG